MTQLFLIVLLISDVLLLSLIIHSIHQKNKLSSAVTAFLFQAIIFISAYGATFFISSAKIVHALNNLIMISIIWYLFFFTYYLSNVTQTQFVKKAKYNNKFLIKFSKTEKYFPIALTIIDSIFVLFDVNFHFLFTSIQQPYAGSNLIFWKNEYTDYFQFHLYIYSIFLTMISLISVRKIFKANFMFRKIYISLSLALTALVFFNFFFLFADIKIDLAFLCYIYISVLFWHYTYFTLPKEQNHFLLTLYSNSLSNGLACFDKDDKLIYSNKLCNEYFTAEKKEQIQKNIEKYHKKLHSKKSNTDNFSSEDTIIINGVERYFFVEHQNLYDYKNRQTGSFIKLQEKTDEINKINKAKYRSTYDELTGLYNRRTFFEKAEKLIKESPEVPRYMIVTNILNYSLLNDLFGVRLGNTVLQKQAKMLTYAKYDDVIFGRISYDKCAMLIKIADFKEDLAVKNTQEIQKITTSLNYKLKIYIGVYELINATEKPVSMCDKAILAINSIKGDYQQTIAFYNSTMLDSVLSQRTILGEFTKTLHNNEFQMYLAPFIDNDGKCRKAEALVRWIHPQLGTLTPSYFLPSLENSGYIFALDSYMWLNAAEKIQEWQNNGLTDLSIAVNISSKDFYHADLYIVLTDLVEKYNIPAEKLILHIQPDVLKDLTEQNIEYINSLNQYGFKIELDSFGNDFETLHLLKNLNVTGIVFNMQNSNLSENQESFEKYIKGIGNLAKDLNLDFSATDVIDEKQKALLQKNGCSSMQGHFFDKPMPVSDFELKYAGDDYVE